MASSSSTNNFPELTTNLLGPQIFAKTELLKLYNQRRKNKNAGAILSLAYGGGKSLTVLSFCKDILGTWDNNPILIVSPFSVIYDWMREGKTHFSPELQTVFLESKNANIKSWDDLSSKHVVFINYEMLVQAFDLALDAREKIYLNKLLSMRQKYKSGTIDISQMSSIERHTFQKKTEMINLLETLKNQHIANPDLSKPIPIQKLAAKEKNKIHTSSLISLYYRKWPVIGYDEVHVARTDTTRKHQACLQLRADFKISITATPFNNGIPDFISAFKLANITPEVKDTTWEDVENDNDLCATVISNLRNKYVIHKFSDSEKSNLCEAQDIIVYQPFIHEEERMLYQKIKKSKELETYECPLKFICPLQQACVGIYNKSIIHPSMAQKFIPIQDQNGEFHKVAFAMPTKIIMLLYMLAQVIEGWNNIVIFTEFKDTARCVVQHIQQAFPDVIVLMATGDTPAKERERIRMIFEDKTITYSPETVVAATREQRPPQKKLRDAAFPAHKAGASKSKILVCTHIFSEGVNLPEANVTFHLDIWWNPARDDQAKNRTDRPGQTHNTLHITLMIADDTIEKDIWMVREGKKDINRIIMSGGTIDASMINKVTTSSAPSTLKKLGHISLSSSSSSSSSSSYCISCKSSLLERKEANVIYIDCPKCGHISSFSSTSSSSSSSTDIESDFTAKMKFLSSVLPETMVSNLKSISKTSFLDLMRSRCDLLITDCRDTTSYSLPKFRLLANSIKVRKNCNEDKPLIEKISALERAKILEKRYTFAPHSSSSSSSKRSRTEISNEKKKMIRIPDSENFF